MSALTDALVAAQAELPTAISRDSQGQGYSRPPVGTDGAED